MEAGHIRRSAQGLATAAVCLLALAVRADDCPSCGSSPTTTSSSGSDLWRSRQSGASRLAIRPTNSGAALRWMPTSTRPTGVSRTAAQAPVRSVGHPARRPAPTASIASRDEAPGRAGSQAALLPTPPPAQVRRSSQIFGYLPVPRSLTRPTPPMRPLPAPDAGQASASQPAAATAARPASRPVSQNPYRQPLGW